MYLELKRIEQNDKQTIGHLFVRQDNGNVLAIFSTIELPWRDNTIQKSCIPVGEYQVVKRWSIRYGDHFHLKDVVGRSMILIHKGNYFNQTLGCILIGWYHKDIDNDGLLDVVNSNEAMRSLYSMLVQKSTYIEVSDVRDLTVL